MWTLLLVVFVDLVGFGLLTPLIPFYVLRTGVSVDAVTLIVAAYSLTQFVCMPLWGHLSDRIGRRPVLMISMAGHVATYVLLGFAETWWMLLIVRVLGGATAANLATAYAYAADVTPREGHAKAFGKISAAFGLGFVIGPAIGGFLAGGGDMAQANFALPAFFAAGLSVVSCIMIYLFLPESLQKAAPEKAAAPQRSYLQSLRAVGQRPIIQGLLTIGVVVIACMSMREAILSVWAHDMFDLSPAQIGMIIATTGAVVVLIQFFAMGPLAARYGSASLVKASFVLFAISWVGLIYAQNLPHVMISAAIGAAATALLQTNLQALVSAEAGAHERGMVMGAYQSSSALARFTGQATVGSIYVYVGSNAPFMIGAFLMVPVMLYFIKVARDISAADRAKTMAAE